MPAARGLCVVPVKIPGGQGEGVLVNHGNLVLGQAIRHAPGIASAGEDHSPAALG